MELAGAAKTIRSRRTFLSVRVGLWLHNFVQLHQIMAPEKRRRVLEDDEELEVFEVESPSSSLQQASVSP